MSLDSAIAVKEWGALCADLATGRRMALVRKGGVADGADGFIVEHPEFWLLPTQFHQAPRDLIPEVAALLPTLAPPPNGRLRLSHFATITDLYRVESESALPRLTGLVGLADTVVQDRFRYRRPGLWLLCLRVMAAPRPQDLDDRPEYAGCHSWVRLEQSLSTIGLTSVLSDGEFARRRGEVSAALAGLPCQHF